MSGGVDSSIAAYLLKKQGYQCQGIFLLFWHDNNFNSPQCAWENQCCSQDSLERARRIAQILKIPFHVYDFRKQFKRHVVDYFIKNYAKGLTPNPCIECNHRIKFGLLLQKAQQLNADYLATGHYVRLRKNDQQIELLKALDRSKDQSYFLYTLAQDQLRFLKFPLGQWYKKDVINLARKLEFPIQKHESQDVCFVPPKSLDQFLKKHLPKSSFKPGPIQTVSGQTVSHHQGLTHYTIGQRQGLNIGGLNEPHYVIHTNYDENILEIGPNAALYQKHLNLRQINFIGKTSPALTNHTLRIKACIRYHDSPQNAWLKLNKNSKEGELTFDKPKRAITPGQSVVFYHGIKLLGGGVIE